MNVTNPVDTGGGGASAFEAPTLEEAAFDETGLAARLLDASGTGPKRPELLATGADWVGGEPRPLPLPELAAPLAAEACGVGGEPRPSRD